MANTLNMDINNLHKRSYEDQTGQRLTYIYLLKAQDKRDRYSCRNTTFTTPLSHEHRRPYNPVARPS